MISNNNKKLLKLIIPQIYCKKAMQPLQNPGLGLPIFDPTLGENKAIPLISIKEKRTFNPCEI